MSTIKRWIHVYFWLLLVGTWIFKHSWWLKTNLIIALIGYLALAIAHIFLLDQQKLIREALITSMTGKDCIGDTQSQSFFIVSATGTVLLLSSAVSSFVYMIADVFN